MSTLSIRLPDSLHKRARVLASQEGTSLNNLIASALAEKLSAIETEAYLQSRAARGRRDPFDAVLAKVPDCEPVEGDALDAD